VQGSELKRKSSEECIYLILSLMYSYVAVCRFCAIRCLIMFRSPLSFSDYWTYVFNIIFCVCFLVLYFCFLFCVFCVSVLFCVLILLLYVAVSFLFLYKFTDHSHRVEIQLQ